MQVCSESNAEFNSTNDEIKKGMNAEHIPKFCATRWTARVSTLSAIIAQYDIVLATLDQIQEESSGDAYSYSRLLTDSQFFVSLFIVHHILSFCAPLTKSLQAANCDLGKAYADASNTKMAIMASRNDETWDVLWQSISSLAETIDLVLSKPRTTGRQVHRANAGNSQSAKDYFKVNVFLPFLDHVVAELASRFELTPEQTGLIAAESLLPNKLHLLTDQNIKDLLGFYSKFLNADENLEAEIKKWKVIHQDQGLNENFPKDAVAALQACEQESFPALHRVFTIFFNNTSW